jgi:hypothetical protein
MEAFTSSAQYEKDKTKMQKNLMKTFKKRRNDWTTPFLSDICSALIVAEFRTARTVEYLKNKFREPKIFAGISV